MSRTAARLPSVSVRREVEVTGGEVEDDGVRQRRGIGPLGPAQEGGSGRAASQGRKQPKRLLPSIFFC